MTDFRNFARGILAAKSGDQVPPLKEAQAFAADYLEQRESKDDAYRQRNHLVAALARLFDSGIRRTDIQGWNPEWHGCVYIDLPTGENGCGPPAQISYHYHDNQAPLFADLPPYTKPYDGHTKEDVHARLRALWDLPCWGAAP